MPPKLGAKKPTSSPVRFTAPGLLHAPPGHFKVPVTSQICPSREPPKHFATTQIAPAVATPQPVPGAPGTKAVRQGPQVGLLLALEPVMPSTWQCYSSPLSQKKPAPQ